MAAMQAVVSSAPAWARILGLRSPSQCALQGMQRTLTYPRWISPRPPFVARRRRGGRLIRAGLGELRQVGLGDRLGRQERDLFRLLAVEELLHLGGGDLALFHRK